MNTEHQMTAEKRLTAPVTRDISEILPNKGALVFQGGQGTSLDQLRTDMEQEQGVLRCSKEGTEVFV